MEPRDSRLLGLECLDRPSGIVTHDDVLRVLEQNYDEQMGVPEAGAREVVVAYPDETLTETLF